jgi:hypothetical protein
MNSPKVSTPKEQSMQEWADSLREAPYPGGTLGYMAFNFLCMTSIWIAALAPPLLFWFRRRAKAKEQDVS